MSVSEQASMDEGTALITKEPCCTPPDLTPYIKQASGYFGLAVTFTAMIAQGGLGFFLSMQALEGLLEHFFDITLPTTATIVGFSIASGFVGVSALAGKVALVNFFNGSAFENWSVFDDIKNTLKDIKERKPSSIFKIINAVLTLIISFTFANLNLLGFHATASLMRRYNLPFLNWIANLLENVWVMGVTSGCSAFANLMGFTGVHAGAVGVFKNILNVVIEDPKYREHKEGVKHNLRMQVGNFLSNLKGYVTDIGDDEATKTNPTLVNWLKKDLLTASYNKVGTAYVELNTKINNMLGRESAITKNFNDWLDKNEFIVYKTQLREKLGGLFDNGDKTITNDLNNWLQKMEDVAKHRQLIELLKARFVKLHNKDFDKLMDEGTIDELFAPFKPKQTGGEQKITGSPPHIAVKIASYLVASAATGIAILGLYNFFPLAMAGAKLWHTFPLAGPIIAHPVTAYIIATSSYLSMACLAFATVPALICKGFDINAHGYKDVLLASAGTIALFQVLTAVASLLGGLPNAAQAVMDKEIWFMIGTALLSSGLIEWSGFLAFFFTKLGTPGANNETHKQAMELFNLIKQRLEGAVENLSSLKTPGQLSTMHDTLFKVSSTTMTDYSSSNKQTDRLVSIDNLQNQITAERYRFCFRSCGRTLREQQPEKIINV